MSGYFVTIVGALILVFILFKLIKFPILWFKTGFDLIKDNTFKGFMGMGMKVAGILFIISGLLVVLLFIQGFLNK